MTIGILGGGNVGATLGRGWAKSGHALVFGSRTPDSDKNRELLASIDGEAKAAGYQEAVDAADAVVLALPWGAVEATLTSLKNWNGKPLLDATNPLTPELQLAVGFDDSGGECVARWAEGARVVKVFNTTGWPNMAQPEIDGRASFMPVCGDDAEANAVALELAGELGFDSVDVGDLKAARYLEPFAMTWITLAFRQGQGPNFAFVRHTR